MSLCKKSLLIMFIATSCLFIAIYTSSRLYVLLAALITVTLLIIFLEKCVLSRIAYLGSSISNIGSNISNRIVITGQDELSSLAGSINNMLDELEQYHSKLRISEAQLHRIADNMLDIVTQVNVEGIIEYVSPSGKTVLGYEPKEQIGRSIFDYIPAEDLKRLSNTLYTGIKTGSLIKTESCRLHADGHYVSMETIGKPLFDSTGAVTGIILVSRDITERKRAEEALQKVHEELERRVIERTDSLVKANEELQNQIIERERIQDAMQHQIKLEKLIALISADFIKVDSEDIDQIINRAMQMIGDFVGADRSYVFLLHDDNEFMSNTHEWCADGIEPQIDNLQMIPSNTYPWWMDKLYRYENIYIERVDALPPEASKEKEFLQEQAIQSLVVVPIIYRKFLLGYLGLDWVREEKSSSPEQITLLRLAAELFANALERQRTEEALATEKTLIDVTLRNISDGVITIDVEQRIVLINNAAAEIIGWPMDDVLGRPFREVFCIADNKTNQIVPDPAGEIIINKHQFDFTDNTTLISKDGSRKIIIHKSNPLKDKDENIIGFVLVFYDVTEQKKVEARLALSQKMESIGQLAAGIAHEINTPMQYIGDNNKFLQDAFKDICEYLIKYHHCLMSIGDGELSKNDWEQLLDMDAKADIEYLVSEIPLAIEQSLEGLSRVSELVLAMKNFAHPGNKEKISADINRGIEGTISISRNEWKYVADMEMDLDYNLLPINCVVDEINQVILNMIVNSAHAIKEAVDRSYYSKGRIYISTRARENSVEITISDNGIGIPESLLERIFDPFFTTKEVGKGTGQGLAITHDIIVNKHQGSIQVESREGIGTSFTITLPITNA